MRTIALVLLAVTATATAQTAAPVPCRVLSAADSTPLRRARIIAVAGGRRSQPVFSDDDGRCEATISPGTDTLRISKAGFAPQELRVTPRPAAIEIRLAHAAVISGRVVDNRGQAAVRVGVTVRRLEPRDAPQPAEAQARTDDRGEFRLGNLVAGRYAVNTRALAPLSDTVVVDASAGEQLDVTLVHNASSVSFPYEDGGVVSGTLLDQHGEPAEGARLALVDVGNTDMGTVPPEADADDRGRFRIHHVPPGRHVLVATPAFEAEEPGVAQPIRVFGGPLDPRGYLPVYYPGTLDAASAVPLQVERERELAAIDMIVPTTRGWRVFGTFISSTPLAAPLELRPIGRSAAARARNRLENTSPEGRFDFPNVAPGAYVLQHVAPAASDSLGPAAFTFASHRVTVTGEDVGPLTLTAAPTSTIRGRVALEGRAATVTPSDFRLTILPVDPADAPASNLISNAVRIGPDWTFRIAGLATPSRIGLAMAPPGWWLKSVTIGDVNAAEQPAPFGSPGDSRNDVAIVLSPNGAALGGRVVDDRRQPVDLYKVIVFSADRERWFKGSAAVTSSAPRSDGRFTVRSLPPGDYFIGAIEYSENDPNAGEVLQQDMLNQLAPSSRRITLGESEQRSVELTLIRLAR
jgi:hypothetical protein